MSQEETALKINADLILKYLHFIFVIVAVHLFTCWSVVAQDYDQTKSDKLLSPNEEQFQEADFLAVPKRSSGCSVVNREFPVHNCHFVAQDEWRNSETLSLYNSDGSLWYSFSLNQQSPIYFVDNTKGFSPFATYPPGNFPPYSVMLRMTGESADWYKVEVNELSCDTKYISKSDPMWAKMKWSYLLYEGVKLEIDFQKTKLHDKPDGKIIKETSDLDFGYVKFLKADGDWAYVEILTKEKRNLGWIRWRNGRNILLGTISNNFKMPEFDPNESKR